jgi:hypothetical protein
LDDIGVCLEACQQKSLRCLSPEIGDSKSSVHTVTKLLPLEPYKFTVTKKNLSLFQQHSSVTGL